MSTPAPKLTVATAWLDGCSGCHMSFLDLDERLMTLVEQVEIVYSPLVDAKTLPAQVDVGILEGSISSEDDLEKARLFRERCAVLISLGDCAVTGNVPAMRNHFKLSEVLDRAYRENVTLQPQIPTRAVPALLTPVKPVHGVVAVDVFIPGCPPSAETIWSILSDVIAGRVPDVSAVTRFGA
ncbi:NAD-reducing hydrogenase small subunit [Allochromatium warmingii]|uniref:NAD-reducing hydrogenase small subunit n=1 Tax=Allochromatium warmingii TaxID=61595 RepID=A0A1H3JGH1_ALLWA|nr:NADP oxidoreductase [Allochromatium warmingii]SDY39001.1 NAD-reducing hydrogenase small subunit [Allochromatium warmingii]